MKLFDNLGASVLFCVVGVTGGFFAGNKFGAESTNPRYVYAEKAAVVTQAVLAHPTPNDEAALKRDIAVPVLAVMQSYIDRGFVVLDAAQDEVCGLQVIAAPKDMKNITAELKTAINNRAKSKEGAAHE